jgi:hypothetical protein
MPTETVAKLLAGNAELGPLTERLGRIRRLQRRYRTLAPEKLAEASRVCAIEGTTVVICATSGPVAAALKQIAPRLLAGLRAPGARNSLKHDGNQELTAIRIEVQVAVAERPRRVQPRAAMPLAQLEKIGEGLAESPLKETLRRITRRK